MADSNDVTFSRIAVEQHFCTPAQIEEALLTQSLSHDWLPIGRHLVNEGFITEEQHSQVLSIQRQAPKRPDPMAGKSREEALLGTLAVREGLLSDADVEDCLREQKRAGQGRSLGEILVSKGLLTPAQVKLLLERQSKKIMSCSTCGLSFTVLTLSKGKSVSCPRCRKPLLEGRPGDSTRTDGEFATQARLPAMPIPPKPEGSKGRVSCKVCHHTFVGPLQGVGRIQCPSCGVLFTPGDPPRQT